MFKSLTVQDKRFLVISCIFMLLMIFASNPGSDGMYSAQEGRTAILTRNMLINGNFIDLQSHWNTPYEKPIGHYWMCLPFAAAFGMAGDPLSVSGAAEWAYRLPSMLSALAALLAVAFLAFRMYGAKTAGVTMMAGSTMMTFLNLAHLAHIDMPLAGAFAVAMLFLYAGYFENMKCNNWIYGFYVMLAWGMLLKGPLVIILAGLAVLGMLILTRRWKMIWELRPLTGLLVFCAVALPWYIAECIRSNGEFFDEFIMRQNISRFIGGASSTYRQGERMALWYYFPKLFAGALPWSVFAVGGILWYAKRIFTFKLHLRTCTWFLLMWAVPAFIFFSFSALKRGDYLLPIYPALAVLSARAAVLFFENVPALSKKWIWVWGALTAVLAAMFALSASGVFIKLGTFLQHSKVKYISRRDAMNMVAFSEYANEYMLLTIIAAVIVSGMIFMLGYFLQRRRNTEAFGVFASAVFLCMMVFTWVIMPATDVLKTVKPFIREARSFVPRGERISYMDDGNDEFLFFMDNPYDRGSTAPDCVYMVTTPSYMEKLEKASPGEWRLLVSTPEKHQYPAVLLKRESTKENKK